MLYRAIFLIFFIAAAVAGECDIASQGSNEKDLGFHVCQLEAQLAVVERALQEVMQKTDTTLLDNESLPINKRKNEFIRFGKRGEGLEKRKNEFIRFGKRKNEFIRFGRSDGAISMNKRKNEFIRFG